MMQDLKFMIANLISNSGLLKKLGRKNVSILIILNSLSSFFSTN